MTQDNKPKDQFITRSGKTIALKPWTYDLIAEHADDVRRFIETWTQVLNGESGDLSAIKNIVPAIKASVQSPDSLNALEGLSDMADLAKAIWDYNEVGVGLGKFMLHRANLYGQILETQEGSLTLSQEPTP